MSEGVVVISDEIKQESMTGMNANKAIAALSRDTVNTHVVAKRSISKA